ncbi:RNA 3'-terminal phosphate cyclase domain-containing protein [Aspergillus varians]
MDPAQQSEPVRLDGRILEGGGQLVRIAVALSALTGRAVTIDHIRGNRIGKQGLGASHLAAIQALGELSGSRLVNARVGSTSIEFYPPPHEQRQAHQTDPEINIRLPTPGSVFLVFQALYPYLLHSASADQIRVGISGGTNVTWSPSYDYVSQVLIPNFARVGLPPISVSLEKRGWSSGEGHLGRVIVAVDTLRGGTSGSPTPSHQMPLIDLHQCQRGTISRIDITVLGPDDHLEELVGESQHAKGTTNTNSRFSKHAAAAEQSDKPETVRGFMERYVHKSLRKRLKELPRDVFSNRSSEATDLDAIPIETHTTEPTHNRSCLYVLIVAHTSTGFRIGRDALNGAAKGKPKPKAKTHQKRPRQDMASRAKGLVDQCVENFIKELYDPLLQADPDSPETAGHRPCVDEYMRDQLVVFEALARVSGDAGQQDVESREDGRYWSLHTKTAQWVCREMLGESCIR